MARLKFSCDDGQTWKSCNDGIWIAVDEKAMPAEAGPVGMIFDFKPHALCIAVMRNELEVIGSDTEPYGEIAERLILEDFMATAVLSCERCHRTVEFLHKVCICADCRVKTD